MPQIKYMVPVFLLFAGTWFLPGYCPVPIAYPGYDHGIMQNDRPSHKAWNRLLSDYVDGQGNVRYKDFLGEKPALEDYLRELALNPPGEDWEREEKLAYYINLYNAATVRLILDHYPLESIRDIQNPWGRKRVRVGEDSLSLDDIEHGILRKMDEPRIHFAVNCASRSCPRLWDRAFTAKELEEQLEMASRAFINDTSMNRLEGEKLVLSKIFQWYGKDFGDKEALLRFIDHHSPAYIRPDVRITYSKYDWSLNDSR